MKAIFISITKKIFYVLAILVVFAALMMTIGPTLRPVLNQYRPDIEKMASELLKAPVTVDEVAVAWYQYQPGISLKRVTVFDKTKKNPVLNVKKIGIFFSLPQSVWHWQPIPSRIMLNGTSVSLHQDQKGEIQVQGLSSGQPYQSETTLDNVMQWLSSQPSLIVRNIDIHYTPFKGPQRFVTLYDLSFNNSAATHIILGKAILHQNVATDVTVAVQWEGQTFDPAKIKAKIYLYVSGFSFSQWLSSFSWNGWQVNNGIGSAKIWATWNHNEIRRVQTTFQLYDLALYSQFDKSLHKINRISGDAGWRHEGANQIFAAEDILIDLPSHLWPVTSFYVSLGKDASGAFVPKSANIGYVDLSDVQPFLFSTPGLLTDNVKKTLTGLQLDGAVQNAAVVFSGAWNDTSKISLNASVSQLSIVPWHQLPGVSNVSGLLRWNGTQGSLSLHSKHVAFDYDTVFANELEAEQLTGDLQLHYEEGKGWIISIPALQILNTSLAANVSGDVIIPPDNQVYTDIKGSFLLLKASQISHYLPLKNFDPGLVEWLQQAFLSGDVKAGQIELKGRLTDFPFDNNTGVIKVSGVINNIDLRCAPDWPQIQQIKGKLVYAGRQITIDVDQARMFGIPIGPVHADIPYLGDEKPITLTVQPTEIQTDFAQGLKFIHASPLEENIGKMFAPLSASGPITLKLGLTVPFADPSKTHVHGSILLHNNDVKLVPWKLNLSKLNGVINFTEDTTDAKSVQGILFNKPMQFSLATIQKSRETAIFRATYATNLAVNDLETWLKVPFSKVATGATDVSGTIDFSGKMPVDIILRSDLNGVALNLPGEYAKTADSKIDFSSEILVQEKQPLRLKLNYGKTLSAALLLNRVNEEMKLTGVNVRLGGGEPTWPPGAGIYVTGNIKSLSWEKIKEYAGNSGDSQFSGYTLKNIDVLIGQLELPGLPLNNIRLQLTPEKNNWGIQVNNANLSGNIRIPKEFNAKGTLTAQFDRLNLSVAKNTKPSKIVISVKSLPAIYLTASNVSYNNMPLGQVTLKTTPSGSGATIQTLRIVSPRMDLQSSGSWGQTTTQLRGTATSTRVSDLLNSLGTDAHNLWRAKATLLSH